MTEINQLERAKLAQKNGLRVQYKVSIPGKYYETNVPQWNNNRIYRVHPDDNEALDAIIWEGAGERDTCAWLFRDEIYSSLIADQASDVVKLIATRELPAEEWNESRIDAIAQNGGDGAHYEAEEAQLFADLKAFVVDFAKSGFRSELGRHNEAKALLERINPKSVRCSSQLPVDTLCEVWSDSGHRDNLFSSGEAGFCVGGRPTTVNGNSEHWDYFKVLQQPQPTFWQGGECPLPEWVKVKIWYRSTTIKAEVLSVPSSALSWGHSNDDADIVAYQIMGEK